MAGAKRAPHSKTRLGCGACKKRRIKCDGRHPVCANCERRALDCSFLLLVPTSRLPSTALTTTSSSTSSVNSTPYTVGVFKSTASSLTSTLESFHITPSNATSPSSRPSPSPSQQSLPSTDPWSQCRASLEPFQRVLLDRYLSSTCRTLATDEEEQDVWQNIIPSMASRHRFLIYGVLSVASLDLARLPERQHERDNLYRIAADQMNRAISLFRVALEDINESNAAALFAHSTLTAVYFFRTSALDMSEARATVPSEGISEPPVHVIDEMLHSFVRTVWGLRGALTVLKPGWNWVIGGELSPICTREWWPKHRIPQTERAKEEDARLAELEKLWVSSQDGEWQCQKDPLLQGHSYDPQVKSLLSKALESLRNTYTLVSLLTDPLSNWPSKTEIPYLVDDTTVGMLKDRATIFTWPVGLAPEFISLAQQKMPEVLVIVAHYAVLLGRVRGIWWIEGLGTNTVWAVAKALGREKWHLVQWPAQALGLDLES
ncbi:uncharacterized protein EI97DRAFT_436849 [Westerdykella ornata]|uniref:Zn(2)-C6 fungal-type domain-containing protein n=1 Tax=Westerdykella ornata TaxID=318751 RepID=A0A6A6J9F0_WESOR|nr:uncharacterized protein EI97DRAFT_436849 [Westerdykella ornata]KAF2272608.1 hypothetical protein EI97DRAFT_436849 [Westerdykella ornata]